MGLIGRQIKIFRDGGENQPVNSLLSPGLLSLGARDLSWTGIGASGFPRLLTRGTLRCKVLGVGRRRRLRGPAPNEAGREPVASGGGVLACLSLGVSNDDCPVTTSHAQGFRHIGGAGSSRGRGFVGVRLAR